MKALKDVIGRTEVLRHEILQTLTDMQCGGDVTSTVETQALLGDLEDLLSEMKTETTKRYDFLRLSVLPAAMDEAGLTSVTVTGVGRVSLVSDAYVSVPVVNIPEFHDWLRDSGSGALIKETVHASTLKAFVKGLIKEGKEFPAELIKVTPFTRAQITRQ
jgi:hypothetical protein